MRNSNSKVRCIKRKLSKCADLNGICKTYSDIQYKYADMLEADESVESYKCNVTLAGFPLTDGLFTTDFLITLVDGELAVGECVLREYINRPFHIRLLDASRNYWLKRGIQPQNWRIITNADKRFGKKQ